MKQILGMLMLMISLSAVAQDKKAKVKVQEPKASKVKPDYSKIDLSKRASDHFMLQFGIAGWGNKDANNITTKGFNRSFNGYFLFDFTFKSNPHLSVAVGPGVGSDNIYFDNMSVDLNTRNGATFRRDTITQYKKNKLETSFLEAPIELRYSARPDNMNKGWIGTLVGAKVKSKVDLDASGTGGYISKEKDKRYLNTTRFALTARAGLGNLSFFGTYTVTSFFKEGLGPSVRPFSFGLALSGL